MSEAARGRLGRMKRGYRWFASVVAAIVGLCAGFAFGSLDKEATVAESISLGVIGAVILGGGTYFGMLGVLAAMQGRAILGGSKSDDSEERQGRGS